MLDIVKFIFQLRGFLSGYKTYLVAFAGVLAVSAQFITGSVVPFLDGDGSTLEFFTTFVPQYVEAVAIYFGLGTVRAGIESK